MLPQKNNQTPSIEKLLDQLKPRLKEAGFRSLDDLVLKGATAISQSTGLDLKICQNICDKAGHRLAQQTVPHERIRLASDLHKRSVNMEAISTGSYNLDSLF